jgi:hypothetical protein
VTITVAIKCTFDFFGLRLEKDPMSHRNSVADVEQYPSASHIAWKDVLQSHTIIQVALVSVFTVQDVQVALSAIDISSRESVSLLVALYRPKPKDQDAPLPQIAHDQLRVVHHIFHGWDLSEPFFLVTASNLDNMASGTKLTRRKCRKGPDRDKWIDAEFSQLGKHHSYGMYGSNLTRSEVPSDAKIVHPIWNYFEKGKGEHKGHKCMDGKQLVRLGTNIRSTYAACMEQHTLRLLWRSLITLSIS